MTISCPQVPLFEESGTQTSPGNSPLERRTFTDSYPTLERGLPSLDRRTFADSYPTLERSSHLGNDPQQYRFSEERYRLESVRPDGIGATGGTRSTGCGTSNSVETLDLQGTDEVVELSGDALRNGGVGEKEPDTREQALSFKVLIYDFVLPQICT